MSKLDELAQEVEALTARVADLENRIGDNSNTVSVSDNAPIDFRHLQHVLTKHFAMDRPEADTVVLGANGQPIESAPAPDNA